MRRHACGSPVGVALLAIGLWAPPAAAQKTDVVVLRSGDRITGEIKELSKGLLNYKTDDLGTVYIEWYKVAQLTSRYYFEVRTANGRKYYGTFPEDSPEGTIVVLLNRADTLALDAVVAIVPISVSFWSRVDGHLDVGFTFQRAKNTLQLTTGTQIRYRGQKLESIFDGSLYVQHQDSATPTTRASASATERYFLTPRWDTRAQLTLEHNDELSLALRTTGGLLAFNQTVETNRLEVGVGGGLILSSERYTPGDTTQISLEGAVGGELAAFRYDRPKLDLTFDVAVYPGITTLGRVRIEADARVSYEIVKDFFFTISAFERFDSKPPAADAQKQDFGITLSVSWTF